MSLVVTGLPENPSLSELFILFSSYGKILEFKMRSKKVFFTYLQYESAISAQKKLNGYSIGNSVISVKINKIHKLETPVQLFVYNINYRTTKEKLQWYFEKVGQVIQVRKNQRRRGTAYILMRNQFSAQRAVSMLNCARVDNRKILVRYSQKRRDPQKNASEQAADINKATELYVRNLKAKTTGEELKSHFSQVGTVLSAKIQTSYGKSLKYGFVVLQSEKEAQLALLTLNGSELQGRKINIEVSRSQRVPVKQNLSTDKHIEQTAPSAAEKIKHIFGLSRKSQKQKAELIHKLQQQFEQLDDQQLITAFNEQLHHTIQLRLGECSTEPQFQLLNMVEYFALRGSQMAVKKDDQGSNWKTPIFEGMKRYGILKRIKSLFERRFEMEKNQQNQPFSQLTEQITRIYLLITYGRDFIESMIEKIWHVVSWDITSLIENMKKISMIQQSQVKDHDSNKLEVKDHDSNKLEVKDHDNNKLEVKDQGTDSLEVKDHGTDSLEVKDHGTDSFEVNNQDKYIEDQMNSLTKLLFGLELMSMNNWNRKRLNTQFKAHERISQLVHINCPPNLSCSRNFIAKASQTLMQLQASAFNVLSVLRTWNLQINYDLINEQQVILHLSELISNSSSLLLQAQLDNDIEQLPYCSNTQIINNFLTVLKIYGRYMPSFEELTQISSFLPALNKLSNYSHNQSTDQQQELQSSIIRSKCRQAVNYIQINGDFSIQVKLLSSGYIRGLVISASICCDFNEDKKDLLKVMINITRFMNGIRFGRFRGQQQSKLHQLPSLICDSEEEIEEECGIEEIDSQLFRKGRGFNYNIYYLAYKAKLSILNYLKYDDNQDEEDQEEEEEEEEEEQEEEQEEEYEEDQEEDQGNQRPE